MRCIGHPRLETRAVTRDSLAEDGRVKGRVAQMRIAMIGTGYVGLVSGVCFSDFGHDVVCVDKDPRKIAMLEGGEVPIYESGLDALMAKNVEAGRLSFTCVSMFPQNGQRIGRSPLFISASNCGFSPLIHSHYRSAARFWVEGNSGRKLWWCRSAKAGNFPDVSGDRLTTPGQWTCLRSGRLRDFASTS